MEEEAFKNEELASYLNQHFISIKIDREERPDLDHQYMAIVTQITGQGGWPLHVWLTPSLKPIYGGTYFPPVDHVGKPGFRRVLEHIASVWEEKAATLEEKGEAFLEQMKTLGIIEPMPLEEEVCNVSAKEIMSRFDPVYGGFSKAPKFPTPHQLLYLMAYEQEHRSAELRGMVEKTLVAMAAGGLHDHVGGGFARYSVDERWEIPHFEKMLYDNLLLLKTYNMAFFNYKNPVYKTIAYRIVDFLRREMLSLKGGFYTALDADSEGREGAYYIYSIDEIREVLGEDSEAFAKDYLMSKKGNFEGKNHLHIREEDVSEEFFVKWEEALKQLLTYREQRVRPALDYKILTWQNGLAVSVLAHMARLYGDEQIWILSKEAKDFVVWDLRVENRLVSHITSKVRGKHVFLDDYAYYIEGLIEIYMTRFDPLYLQEAVEMMEEALDLFWDEKWGAFFFTEKDNQDVHLRQKHFVDGATPSGNSVMGHNLYRLYVLTEEPRYESLFRELLEAYGHYLKKASSYCSYGLLPLLQEERGSRLLKIALAEGEKADLLYQEIGYETMNYDVVRLVEDTNLYPLKNQSRTYYSCQGFVCQEPSNELPKA
ncbi:MAG: thioredoxin domain-containing protein [Vallitaleaceae bacterium]|nr:thioredoxin domain-containing protein [Vallitaleaceae bacterium]